MLKGNNSLKFPIAVVSLINTLYFFLFEDDVESCLYLLVGGNRAILQYPLCGIGKQENLMSYIDVTDIEKVSVIDQDKSRILYSDLNKGIIAITSLEKDKNKQRYSSLPCFILHLLHLTVNKRCQINKFCILQLK